jgi:hypothetical protein
VNAGRNWTPTEAESHINYLEILAVLFALKSFSSQISGKHVKVLIDNTTAVAGINQMVSFPPHKSQTCLPHMGMCRIPGLPTTRTDVSSRAPEIYYNSIIIL